MNLQILAVILTLSPWGAWNRLSEVIAVNTQARPRAALRHGKTVHPAVYLRALPIAPSVRAAQTLRSKWHSIAETLKC